MDKGMHNENQGPDFLNAKIKIGDTILAGNIELHIHSSDWFRHRHASDSNYNNIILHLVWKHDIAGNKIQQYPVVELQPYVSNMMLQQYAVMMEQFSFIPCENQIRSVSALVLQNWKERILIERLEQKTTNILASLKKNNWNWEETFWQKLARSFGGTVNGDALEAMAIQTPHLLLAKNKIAVVKLESILMGQAGMLNGTFEDNYAVMLQKEYKYLQKKYRLTMSPFAPQYLRMRPFGFPSIRLSQLAALIFRSSHLFSKILDCSAYKELLQFFDVQANDYWNHHYKLDDAASAYQEKHLGTGMVHHILINTVAPMVFSYGIYKKDESFKQKALQWLEALPAEENKIIKEFKKIFIKSRSAADSQAWLQLKDHYCNQKRCLQCAIGAAVLKG
jgi:hypothetical protein